MSLAFLFNHSLSKSWLEGQLGYYADTLLSLSQGTGFEPTKESKRIVIVAKQHYSESVESLASISKQELTKILALKKGANNKINTLCQVKENKAIDGFDIKYIEFSAAVIEKLGQQSVLIPETELIASQASSDVLACDTPAGKLFIASASGKVVSAYAKGLMASADTFKLSAGVAANATIKHIALPNYATLLVNALKQVRLTELKKLCLIDAKSLFNLHMAHWLYLAPLGTAVVFYLVVNAYLALSIYQAETELADGGSKVNLLLKQKTEIDKNNQTVALLASELNNKPLIHPYWNITEQILKSGATIKRVTYNDGELIIRGSAPKASTVLADLNKFQMVASASFNGPVRSSRGNDVFIIKVVPKEQV